MADSRTDQASDERVQGTDVAAGDTKEDVFEELDARRADKRRFPYLNLDMDDETRTLTLRLEGDDQELVHALAKLALGTTENRVLDGFLRQVSDIGDAHNEISEDATNFVLGIVGGIQPQDEVEAMLATQMAVTHQASLTMVKRLTRAQTIQQQDAAEKAFNKLARTYTTQMDALKKYRAKAQQTVRVERVTVEEGGQAIVGDVAYRRGDDGER